LERLPVQYINNPACVKLRCCKIFIMTQLMVASFTSECQAMHAYKKLQDLELFGVITIYDRLMAHKKADGRFEIVREHSKDCWNVITGMVLGGLLGSIAGPVGFIAGVFAGTGIGVMAEINHYNLSADFITKVEERMAADTVAIIAETDEMSDEFINVYVRPFDAVVVTAPVCMQAGNCCSKAIVENEAAIAAAVLAFKKGEHRDAAKLQIADLKEKRKYVLEKFEEAGLALSKLEI